MPLADNQAQVRGLVVGPGTSFRLMSDFNPFRVQARAAQAGARPWSHGGWSGAEWAEPRVVPMRILVDGSDPQSWLSLHHQIAAAFAPVGDDAAAVELRWAVGGQEFVLFGRPRMAEADSELVGAGKGFTRCAFVALDPYIYSADEVVTGPVGLPTFVGGLTVPATNLLANPSFEDGLDGWQVGSNGPGSTAQVVVDVAATHGGNVVELASVDDTSAITVQTDSAAVVPASEGDVFTASVDVTSISGPDRGLLYLFALDSGLGFITSAQTTLDGVGRFAASMTMPANSAFVRVVLRVVTPDIFTFRADAVQLERGLTATPFVPAPGVTAPLTVSAVAQGGAAPAVNAGTAAAPATFDVAGPVSDPRVVVDGPDGVQSFTVGVAVSAGQTLTVDTATRSVLLDGTVSRRGQMSGDFPTLQPGTSDVYFRARAGAGNLTMTHRSAWW